MRNFSNGNMRMRIVILRNVNVRRSVMRVQEEGLLCLRLDFNVHNLHTGWRMFNHRFLSMRR